MTQDFSILESLIFSISALVLGMLELIFLSSLLVQILSMLGPAFFAFSAQVLTILEPILCTSEVHALSMFEPLTFPLFFGTFSLFLENKNCSGMYNGNGNWNFENQQN